MTREERRIERIEKRQKSLRVFIGTSPGGQDAEACAVLEHSLRKRATIPVAIERLCVSHIPKTTMYGWQTERWATPWTALRWTIPELCGWRGRAVYFDCPTLVLGDIATLATAEIPAGAFLLLRRQGRTLATSCIVFDCAAARPELPTIANQRRDIGSHQTVGRLLERRPKFVAPLPNGWGASDMEFSSGPAIAWGSVHFASPFTQPHVPLARTRLARAGKQHWFNEVTLPHYCPALRGMFEQEYAEVQAAQQTEAAE